MSNLGSYLALRTAHDFEQFKDAVIDAFDEQTHTNYAQLQAVDTLRQTINICLERIQELENEVKELKDNQK